jgi:multidrug efflux pump subunit AcrA (membrane-fusion protein)
VESRAQLASREQAARMRMTGIRDRLEVRLASLASSLELHRSQQTITAPVDGWVTDLKVSGAGQFVPAGQELLTLVPAGSRFIAELDVANRDISRVRAGMKVKLRLETFSEREFAPIEGKVATVPANVASLSLPDSAPYRIRVELDSQSVRRNGREYPFRLGMAALGSIVIEHRSILQLALDRLFRLRDETLR